MYISRPELLIQGSQQDIQVDDELQWCMRFSFNTNQLIGRVLMTDLNMNPLPQTRNIYVNAGSILSATPTPVPTFAGFTSIASPQPVTFANLASAFLPAVDIQ
jgi:hypothetical protein